MGRIIYLILIPLFLLIQDNLPRKPNETLKYKWLERSNEMDFVVGISIDNEPVCTGALINPFLVITTANPFHYRIPGGVKLTEHNVKCHLVHNVWNESNSTDVVCIEYQYKAHNLEWDPFGPDETKKHSPHHDCAILTLKHNVSSFQRQYYYHTPRYPFYKYIVRTFPIYRNNIIKIAGHGFMDKVHVKQNIELDIVEYLAEDVLENCSEWFPNSWGYFLCMLNTDNFVGINAGAVMTQGDLLISIGSFSLTKGGETVLAFTHMAAYGPGNIKYCKLEPGEYALSPLFNITTYS